MYGKHWQGPQHFYTPVLGDDHLILRGGLAEFGNKYSDLGWAENKYFDLDQLENENKYFDPPDSNIQY